ncbi:hypothetical protein J6590_048897 [Homalodisca vitripennis]|nr:hypothetical protein J6590_048897 [Homalodisca vitripennis]
MQLPLFPQIRPCHLYEDEYDDCTSIRARFQQYFVLGHWEDCTPWKHDYYNCEKWKNNKDKAAAPTLDCTALCRSLYPVLSHVLPPPSLTSPCSFRPIFTPQRVYRTDQLD